MWSHIYCTAFCTVQCNASQYNTYCYFVLKHTNQYRFYKDYKKKPITSDWSTMIACCELLIQSSKKGSQYVWHWILLTWYEWCRWVDGASLWPNVYLTLPIFTYFKMSTSTRLNYGFGVCRLCEGNNWKKWNITFRKIFKWKWPFLI